MDRPTTIALNIAGLLLYGAAVAADDMEVPLLPLQCEVELALSAAPHYLRDEATVYALTQEGLARARSGSNPFTCVVNRDHPKVLKPTCYDAEGAQTILPKVRWFAERLLAGQPLDEIQDSVREGFDEGRFRSPNRAGVAYMLSRYNRPYNSTTRSLGWFPPHVMFYAPNLTNQDIGHDMRFHDPDQPLPMIGYQGPHGYMIMISDDGTPRSRADLPHCPDWVFQETTDGQQ